MQLSTNHHYWVVRGIHPNCRKVVPIARTLGEQYIKGDVPLLSGSRSNSDVCITSVCRYFSQKRILFWICIRAFTMIQALTRASHSAGVERGNLGAFRF